MISHCLCLLFVLVTPGAARPLDQERLLEAIAQKETGGSWDGRPGPCGELSRYQISFDVWIQYSAEPFAEARNEGKARVVALRHLAWLSRRIAAAHQLVTVERLGTCWHFGSSHARRPSAWGVMVANLYEDSTWR